MKKLFEVWVRVGDNAGPVEPKDKQPLETFGEAVAMAREFLPQAHEVIIIERRVAQRLQGLLPPLKPDSVRGDLEAKGHAFGGSPLRCIHCGAMIGVLSALGDEAPACRQVQE